MTAIDRSLFVLRLTVASALLVLPLLGCLGPPDDTTAPEVQRCSADSAVVWTPTRIALFDLSGSTAEELADGSAVGLIRGGQGANMVGLELVVHGDAVPGCVEAQVDLDGYFNEYGPLRLEVSADGTTGSALVYEISDRPGASRASAVVGDQSVEFDVEVVD